MGRGRGRDRDRGPARRSEGRGAESAPSVRPVPASVNVRSFRASLASRMTPSNPVGAPDQDRGEPRVCTDRGHPPVSRASNAPFPARVHRAKLEEESPKAPRVWIVCPDAVLSRRLLKLPLPLLTRVRRGDGREQAVTPSYYTQHRSPRVSASRVTARSRARPDPHDRLRPPGAGWIPGPRSVCTLLT